MLDLTNPYDIKFKNFKKNEDILNYIFTNNESKIVNFIYFANYTLLEKNEDYLEALTNSDLVLIDGIGMQIYFKRKYKCKVYNNNGTDLLPMILNYCRLKLINVAFYGAKEDTIKKCYLKYENSYYYQNGYTELNWSKIENNSVLLVGKGSPIQEIWINSNQKIIRDKNIIVIGVGGFFDFYSGASKRAPDLVVKLKLEWLHRLFLNPRQHIKKNLRNLLIIKYL